MFLELKESKGNEQIIYEMRKKVLAAMGAPVETKAADPLPFAFYVFAYNKKGETPIAFTEFFIYDQRFESFEDSQYGKAADLANYGDLSEFTHIRSLYISSQARRVGTLYRILSQSLVIISVEFGVKYATAGTPADNDYQISIFERTGGKIIGKYPFENKEHNLIIFNLTEIIKEDITERTKKYFSYDNTLMQKIRRRREN